MRHSLFCLYLAASILAVPFATAQESDPDLPQPFDATALDPVLASSPFTRSVNLSDSLVLTGVAYVEGKAIATLFDKEKGQSLVVTEEPNVQGWTLTEAIPTSNLTRAQAKVQIGGEVVTIRYSNEDLVSKSDSERRGPPPGGDRGGDGDRFRKSGRGPSEEDRKRYESLSENAREKFRNVMREKFTDEKFRNAPEEERRAVIKREFDRIEKEDKGGGR